MTSRFGPARPGVGDRLARGRAARSLLLRGLLLGALVGLAACGGDARRPVVVYTPHGRDLMQLLEGEFERAHPDLDLRYLDMGSQEIVDRLRSERAHPQADVWFGGPDAIFARGAEAGLLAAFRPSWAEAVPAASRAAGDLYFGVYRTLPVLVFQEKLVDAAEAPADWDDLLQPRFTGKILLRDPIASGVMRTVFGMILARSVGATGSTASGFAWLARLDEQTKEIVANPALLHQKLLRGEGEATMWELTDILLERAHGSPFGYRFARSGTPVIDDAVGLVAGAPHLAAAQAWIEFVGSPAAATLAVERAYRIPAREDLPAASLPEWARQALAEMRPAVYDEALAAARGQEWMAEWDRSIRGRGLAAIPAELEESAGGAPSLPPEP